MRGTADREVGDTIAQVLPEHAGIALRRDDVKLGLHVQDRYVAAGKEVIDWRALLCKRLHGHQLRIPAVQPWFRVVTGREEHRSQAFQTYRIRQGCIPATLDLGAHFRWNRHGIYALRHLPCRARQQYQRAHQVRSIARHGARDPVAMCVPDDHDWGLACVLDHRRDILSPIVQRLVGQRARAAAIAARLRAENPVSGGRQRFSQLQHVGSAAPERWQQHNDRTGTQLIDLDRNRC
ncbi:hypothetical protein FHX61_001969 [Cupriavidus alkaliphilus]|uniref:Uncharacterized protein n=1 Tax=Cupriavidus alkaliphilus TaxID=942866 RepID=A0A7W4YRQ3_9BURK|nr:hypothetical protein [Cupriavidus alkaliphilus]